MAKTSYPKFRGDAQNTGRGGGAGAEGKKAWEFKTGGGVPCSAAIGADGTVYIVSNDHKLYALDGKTGAKKWEYDNGTLGGSSSTAAQAPAIGADGTIYVGDPGGYSDENRGQLVAVDGATGKMKWEFKAKAPVYSSPAIGNNGIIYFGSNDAFVYAVDSATGKQKWKFETGRQVKSTPAIGADGTVYFGSQDQNVYAVDGLTGKQKWSFATGSYVEASPAIGADGTVYISRTGSLQTGPATLYALDPADGSKKWDFEADRNVYSSPALGADGMIYIGCDDEKVYAIR